MSEQQVALYARVSSSQQADAGTIASQLAALRERIAADGGTVLPHLEFIDEGYSGGTFVRPALERLRDAAYAGEVDRLYVSDPDRLARKYAYQVVLLEEFQRAGVEVVLLHHPAGRTPEAELLLQIQGMMAEYERAKILERTRRGKRHAASQGAVSVLSGAPYGYRYVTKQEGGGRARLRDLGRGGADRPPSFRVGGSRPRDDRGGLSPAGAPGRGDALGQDGVDPLDRGEDVEEPGVYRCRAVRPHASWGAPAAPAARARTRRAAQAPLLGSPHAERGMDPGAGSGPDIPGTVSKPCKSNCARIGNASANAERGTGICSRGWSSVARVAMAFMAGRCRHGRGMGSRIFTIAAIARTPRGAPRRWSARTRWSAGTARRGGMDGSPRLAQRPLSPGARVSPPPGRARRRGAGYDFGGARDPARESSPRQRAAHRQLCRRPD